MDDNLESTFRVLRICGEQNGARRGFFFQNESKPFSVGFRAFLSARRVSSAVPFLIFFRDDIRVKRETPKIRHVAVNFRRGRGK